MVEQNDRTERLGRTRTLVEHASGLAQARDYSAARRRLDEAAMVLGVLGDDNDPVRLELDASICEGKGQIAMAVARLDEAYFQLSRALDLRTRRNRVAGGDTDRLQIAIAHLNLSATCSQLGRLDEAITENRAALDELTLLGDEPTARFMSVATLHSQGMLLGQTEQRGAALDAYRRAREVGQALLATGEVDELPQLVTQVEIAASVAHYEAEDPAGALALGESAATRAWATFEASESEGTLTQYVTAQMNLVTFQETVGDFAAAEDALFRVLKLVGPQPEVLTRGRRLYTDLLALDDAALAAGNLPRDEVEESLSELDAMVNDAAQA